MAKKTFRENSSLYQLVGARLREARGKRTQKDLAAHVNLNRSSIAKIEAGTQKITIDILYSIANELGKSPRDFLPEIEHSVPEHHSAKAILKKGLAADQLNSDEFNSVLKAVTSKRKL